MNALLANIVAVSPVVPIPVDGGVPPWVVFLYRFGFGWLVPLITGHLHT